MPQIAWATTATATSFKPWITPEASGPSRLPATSANTSNASADGKVKPIHASIPPITPPPRTMPSAKPTWLLAGPGRN